MLLTTVPVFVEIDGYRLGSTVKGTHEKLPAPANIISVLNIELVE